MSLRLTNTLTKKKEDFFSLVPNKVSIYCCGVTVYDLCHIGHARSYIVWDILRRFLTWEGFEVTFVQNFTDIDDKILKKAAEEGCSTNEITERNIKAFHRDMDSLGILRPDSMPRATNCIDGICNLIRELEDKGAAYSKNGDVYFSVEKHKEYGKLSQRSLEEQQIDAHGRLTKGEKENKKNQFDFALWKSAKEGETSFPSPWGAGRPGWHIECSAMVRKELGETIDIHLGGSDLVFPHHENEIAQSETANGKELAKYWLHNGMVNVEGKKMSKSLGNFKTIRSLLESGYSAMSLRLFVLQTHYRKPLDFTQDALDSAAKGWDGINSALCISLKYFNYLNWPHPHKAIEVLDNQSKEEVLTEEYSKQYQSFIEAMNDDLNTSAALSVIFQIAKPLRSLSNNIERGSIDVITELEKAKHYNRWKFLLKLTNILGLKAEINNINPINKELSNEAIETLIKERIDAKLLRDFSRADQIREVLRNKGIDLIDKKDGTTSWIFIK
ncbi:cysteine--tRNA ligase [Prochlorococcus sp. MIT 1223]|uniref:cysteine--tRNA ligase n=1 Tax=Prochlorococcus sp. MIT 1223 TaxID=3096217 RepID=UPI002A748978|nr:cysteine--tRNA ligase [Prochlorococcus sp. MIT 1223]